jgi:pimeloyl-ACP methyl ester carboxylesterase
LDNTIPYRSTAAIIELIPRAQVVTVNGGGHDLTLEEEDGKAQTVADALLNFFIS